MEISDQIIWYNSNVLINGKPVIWKSWWEKGIILIEDLYSGNVLKSCNELGVNWLEYLQLTQAIPTEWKMKMVNSENSGRTRKDSFDEFLTCKHVTKKAYICLLYDEHLVDKYHQRWAEEENVVVDLNWYNENFM